MIASGIGKEEREGRRETEGEGGTRKPVNRDHGGAQVRKRREE
jgi:hypothetical protein